jgi:hypothetical protein
MPAHHTTLLQQPGNSLPPGIGFLGQPLARWLCKTQGLSQRPGRRGQTASGFGSSQQGHFAPAVGFSTQQPGEFVFKPTFKGVWYAAVNFALLPL